MLKLFLLVASATTVFGIALNFPRAICDQYDSTIAINVISGVPSKSKFIQVKGNVPSLVEKLIENATTIRENIVDTFSCHNKVYGYYADQDNGCQIFHICVPMQQLFPDLYCADDIFHFSFICPKHTIFSQDAMVCDWADNAFPCSEADKLYDRNNLFFVVPEDDVQRESVSVSTTPSTVPSQSMCCSSKAQKVEARHNIKDPLQHEPTSPVTDSLDPLQHEPTSPVTDSLKTFVEIPQTFPPQIQQEDPLPTTTVTEAAPEDITTWPSTNLGPLIFSDSKQYHQANSLPKALHVYDSAILPNSLPIQKYEEESLTERTLLPETTLPEHLTEEPVELPNSTFPPELEHFIHPPVSQSTTKSSKLKNRRSDTSKEKPPIVMYIEGVGFQVIPNS